MGHGYDVTAEVMIIEYWKRYSVCGFYCSLSREKSLAIEYHTVAFDVISTKECSPLLCEVDNKERGHLLF